MLFLCTLWTPVSGPNMVSGATENTMTLPQLHPLQQQLLVPQSHKTLPAGCQRLPRSTLTWTGLLAAAQPVLLKTLPGGVFLQIAFWVHQQCGNQHEERAASKGNRKGGKKL